MRAASASQPVFSCQQQYTLLDPQTHWPIGEQACAGLCTLESRCCSLLRDWDVACFVGRLPIKAAWEKRLHLQPLGFCLCCATMRCKACILITYACLFAMLGWPERATAAESCSQSFCAVGHGAAVGRDFAEAHMRACLHAGLRVAGACPCSHAILSVGLLSVAACFHEAGCVVASLVQGTALPGLTLCGFLVSTQLYNQRPCLGSGPTRWGLVEASSWGIMCGCHDTSCSGCRSSSRCGLCSLSLQMPHVPGWQL